MHYPYDSKNYMHGSLNIRPRPSCCCENAIASTASILTQVHSHGFNLELATSLESM